MSHGRVRPISARRQKGKDKSKDKERERERESFREGTRAVGRGPLQRVRGKESESEGTEPEPEPEPEAWSANEREARRARHNSSQRARKQSNEKGPVNAQDDKSPKSPEGREARSSIETGADIALLSPARKTDETGSTAFPTWDSMRVKEALATSDSGNHKTAITEDTKEEEHQLSAGADFVEQAVSAMKPPVHTKKRRSGKSRKERETNNSVMEADLRAMREARRIEEMVMPQEFASPWEGGRDRENSGRERENSGKESSGRDGRSSGIDDSSRQKKQPAPTLLMLPTETHSRAVRSVLQSPRVSAMLPSEPPRYSPSPEEPHRELAVLSSPVDASPVGGDSSGGSSRARGRLHAAREMAKQPTPPTPNQSARAKGARPTKHSQSIFDVKPEQQQSPFVFVTPSSTPAPLERQGSGLTRGLSSSNPSLRSFGSERLELPDHSPATCQQNIVPPTPLVALLPTEPPQYSLDGSEESFPSLCGNPSEPPPSNAAQPQPPQAPNNSARRRPASATVRPTPSKWADGNGVDGGQEEERRTTSANGHHDASSTRALHSVDESATAKPTGWRPLIKPKTEGWGWVSVSTEASNASTRVLHDGVPGRSQVGSRVAGVLQALGRVPPEERTWEQLHAALEAVADSPGWDLLCLDGESGTQVLRHVEFVRLAKNTAVERADLIIILSGQLKHVTPHMTCSFDAGECIVPHRNSKSFSSSRASEVLLLRNPEIAARHVVPFESTRVLGIMNVLHELPPMQSLGWPSLEHLALTCPLRIMPQGRRVALAGDNFYVIKNGTVMSDEKRTLLTRGAVLGTRALQHGWGEVVVAHTDVTLLELNVNHLTDTMGSALAGLVEWGLNEVGNGSANLKATAEGVARWRKFQRVVVQKLGVRDAEEDSPQQAIVNVEICDDSRPFTL